MRKRICYIHVGPHKSGTTSIQWFLQENRSELLKHGYFVPESETKRGAHHALAEGLAGLDVGEHRQPLVTKSIQAIAETASEAIIISSEALEGILEIRKHAEVFFGQIRKLNFEPKLVLFPRNQPQWINSSYAFSVMSFRRSDAFQVAALGFARSPGSRFSRWVELADVYRLELIARPFTKETIASGVITEFVTAVGINSSQFRDSEIRRNEAVGPFTVSVAREVLRAIAPSGKALKWLQAEQCKKELARHLKDTGSADVGYCGLSTSLARQMEQELQSDNDAFAQSVWGSAWADIFAADVTEEFTPNDFEICPPNWFTARRLRRAVRAMKARADNILHDPALAVDAPWNDLAHRSGLISKE
ncbi:MAG: hypothetical protein ACJ8KC_10540 [Candidatus Udaeobacter sp.]